MRKFFLVFLLFLGCGVLLGAEAYYIYVKPGESDKPQRLVIPHGGTVKVIATLQEGKILSRSWSSVVVFKAVLFLTRNEGKIHAAELEFPAHASIQKILNVLRFGKPVLHTVTIPEGLSREQISQIINAAPYLAGLVEIKQEADVLPQTYGYTWGMARLQLLQKMQKAQKNTLYGIWNNRDKSSLLSTPEQLLILASIVEKETAVPAERAVIARVFLNRLQKGMKLQSDPTVIYAITQGKYMLGRKLVHTDLLMDSPYNTYLHGNLPPTPICAPGQAALEAVAHPATGNWLYFVSNGNGQHYFSTTLQEHNHHVSLLRKVMQK